MSISKKYFEATMEIRENNWDFTDEVCLVLDNVFNCLSNVLYQKYSDFISVTSDDIKSEAWALLLNAAGKKKIPSCSTLMMYLNTRIKRNLIGTALLNSSRKVKILRIVDKVKTRNECPRDEIKGRKQEKKNIMEQLELFLLKKYLEQLYPDEIVEAWFKKYVEEYPHHFLRDMYKQPVSYDTMQINYFPKIKLHTKNFIENNWII